MMGPISVRREQVDDIPVIDDLTRAAFPSAAEAELIGRLRRQAQPFISLVAEQQGRVVGQITFSPVLLQGAPEMHLLALAPMAVAPNRQGRGIGSTLVEHGMEVCAHEQASAIVVLGHPNYYPRFGFKPARSFGLSTEYQVPDDVFMLRELKPGTLDQHTGLIYYHPVFASLDETSGGSD